MRALPRRAVLAAPAAVLMCALVACGGSDSGSDGSGAADSRQSAQSAGGAEAAGEAGGDTDEKDEKKEPPLTGDIKKKAEAAALAAYPGTVVKSEEDTEKPGMYAVEVKQADGTSIEVYIDKSFKVTDTKKEGTEETGDAG